MTQTSERRGWLGVLSVALGSFVLVLSEFLPIGLLPSIAADLHVTIGTAGLMVVATGLAGAVAAPVVTVLTSRLDRRIVLWSLTILLIVADVIGAFAPTFEVLVAARILLGIGIGGFWAIGAGLAGRLVAEPAVIRATSFITAGVSVATVVSLPLGAFVASVSTWRVAFLIGAVLGVIALVGQIAMLPRIPSLARVRFATLGALLTISRARVGLIGTAFVFLAQFAAYTYVAPYLEDVVRVDGSTITLALLVFGVAGIAGNFLAGVTLSRNLLGTLGVAKFVLAGAVIALPFLAWSVPGVFVLLVVWGFVWGALPLGMQTWMAKASPSASESSLALFVTTIQLSIAAGSIVGGVAVSSFGLGFDFAMAGVIAAAGAILLITLGVRRPRGVGAGAPTLAPVAVSTGTGAIKVPC
ncbi:MFS transporter [Frondihabitans sucicola]|nr:MFS transporter [Frondihabitans sucicola]